MKYTYEQRLDIGRQIYDGELTRFQAAEQYGINECTARSYMWLYRDTNHLPPKSPRRTSSQKESGNVSVAASGLLEQSTLESYETMSKEDLIHELVKARINEARLKKGYEVKGDGTVIHYTSKNTK